MLARAPRNRALRRAARNRTEYTRTRLTAGVPSKFYPLNQPPAVVATAALFVKGLGGHPELVEIIGTGDVRELADRAQRRAAKWQEGLRGDYVLGVCPTKALEGRRERGVPISGRR